MAVGDVNSTAVGSGARYNDGKPDWSLMPTHLLEEVVRVWMYGAKKYAAWNWAKGMAWSIPYACIIRHLHAYWWKGERNDPESGCSHLAHVVCNVMMLMHYERFFPQGDDRPKGVFIEDSSTGYRDGTEHGVCVGPVQAEHRDQPDRGDGQSDVLCRSVSGREVHGLLF